MALSSSGEPMHGVHAVLEEALLDVGLGNRGAQRLVPHADQVGRQAARAEHGKPVHHLVARQELRDQRQVGEQRRRRGEPKAIGIRFAAADLAQELRHVAEHHVAVAGDDVLDGGGAAAIGHVQQIDAGQLLEQLARQMLRGAVARRGIGRSCRGSSSPARSARGTVRNGTCLPNTSML